METLYQALQGIHNLVGIITLLAALVAGALLLATARTQGGGTPLALRVSVIAASLQALLGILLVVIALIAYGPGYVGSFWFHYVIGLVTVGVVSAVGARARRAPDSAARNYGGLLIGVVLLIAFTYWVGMSRFLAA